jgi:hypothetical protein
VSCRMSGHNYFKFYRSGLGVAQLTWMDECLTSPGGNEPAQATVN